MTSTVLPPTADRPAHYRLSTETWEMILKEYREGATAPFLARKWRVSEHALRRRVTQHGATKRDWGDEQAIGQAVAREAELEEARRNSPEAVTSRLFAGIDPEKDESDPAELARTATLTSGRAMRGRLWNEARALAGLADTYSRLAERQVKAPEAARVTVETLDLPQLFDILTADDAVVRARFALWGEGPEAEHYDLKKRFWDQEGELRKAADNAFVATQRRFHALEAQIRKLGGTPPER
ncbi:hypothetical protein [Brevundimonas sp.]|uniref:hypothetical protein n=1 Tax=Brevundimonas sp. TaxID=1871086 RepID=UPI002ABB3E80|nr:hypothetical protein [Brevundimonas sp.]MDZ4362111.1 hypothetical protein [Brevundimonas sp.]